MMYKTETYNTGMWQEFIERNIRDGWAVYLIVDLQKFQSCNTAKHVLVTYVKCIDFSKPLRADDGEMGMFFPSKP